MSIFPFKVQLLAELFLIVSKLNIISASLATRYLKVTRTEATHKKKRIERYPGCSSTKWLTDYFCYCTIHIFLSLSRNDVSINDRQSMIVFDQQFQIIITVI